ncbi:MAG: threonine synthase, threonine synthase [Chloroflexi bacterium CSP1-4]|nr:MAG: threonine synthase, threonine synthase [Chloroflexi bacterium CSP1-4]
MRVSDVLRHLRQQHATAEARPRLLHRYAAFLPLTDATPPLSLGEGYTPLVHATRLGREIGCPELHLKLEGMNPTGSFKDRGMAMAVAKALESGARAIICASTGNTSASAAAYGASAGLAVIVVLPAGRIAAGKLVQAQMAGAKIVAVEGNFDDALRIVRELAEGGSAHGHPVTLVNSVNPHRIQGQKTAAFEVCDDLGGAPDYLAIPVGNAGNITAYWKGFTEYRDAGLVETRPVMLGFQAAGAAPIVLGHRVDQPETVATAIRIGDPASWRAAERARDESGGRIDAVTDDEILAAYRDLAHLEGVFCEPASAAGVAGVRKLVAEGAIDPSATIVCVLTGHGLKDPDTATAQAAQVLVAPATTAGVMEVLGW